MDDERYVDLYFKNYRKHSTSTGDRHPDPVPSDRTDRQDEDLYWEIYEQLEKAEAPISGA